MAARKPREVDPPQALAGLAGTLSREPLATGYVLRGEERYFRQRAESLLLAKAEEAGFEICSHDADTRANPEFRMSRLVEDLSGVGLFAARRLVLVRDPAPHLKPEGKEDSTLTRAVKSFLAAGDAGTVVLSGPSLRADLRAVKAITAAGGPVLSLRKLWDSPPPWKPDPRQAELVLWARSRARELGVGLSADQAVYLAAATGNDLFELDDQIERLRSMPGEAISEVVGWTASAAPWNVADEIAAGDAARSLVGIEVLFGGGFQEKTGRRVIDATALSSMLIGSLSRGIRQSHAIAAALERGEREEDAAKGAGLSGRAVATGVARARRRAPRAWRGLLEDVASLERRAKSSTGVDANDFAALTVRWAVTR